MWAMGLAFLLDCWIGDPVYSFHPVRLMGQGVAHGESFLRRLIKNEYVAGFLLVLIITVLVYVCSFLLIYWAYQVHFALGFLFNVLGIYTAVSVHDMKREAMAVYKVLNEGDIKEARKSLSRIVGRKTKDLKSPEIIRATVETVAESTVDGIVSPLFYAAIGGAPLALAYKAINTLDSMIGHLNQRYRKFGFFAAKIDDLVNWVPARLSYVCIALSSQLLGQHTVNAFKAGGVELKRMGTISTLPEATFAGALKVQLGGTNVYEDRTVQTRLLGESINPLTPETICQSTRLMLASACTTLMSCLFINYLLTKGDLSLWP